MVPILFFLVGLLVGYIIGHDVAVLKQRTAALKEIKPLIDQLHETAKELNKPLPVPPEISALFDDDSTRGRVQ